MSAFNKTFGNSFGRTFRPIFETVVAGEAIVRFLAAWADAAGVSQPLLVGTGPVTTDHAEAILALGSDGNYDTYAVNAPVWRYDADGDYLVSQPEGTNLLFSSNDLTTGSWFFYGGTTLDFNQVGLTGSPSTATLVDKQTTTSSTGYGLVACPDDTNPVSYKIYVKKDSDTSRFPSFSILLYNGSNKAYAIIFNTATGAVLENASTLPHSYNVELIGDFWSITMTLENDGTGNTEIYPYVSPAHTDVWNINEVITATGSIVVGNAEIYLNTTMEEAKSIGPIFTTIAAATTSAFVNEYPAANHSNTEGPYYLEFENTGDDVVLLEAGTDEFLKIEDGGSVEEVANGDFALWTDPTFPDGWNLTITDANTYVEEHAQGMRFVSDGGNLSLGQSSIVTTGNTYEVEIGVVSTTGDVTIRLATTAELGVTYVAVKTAGLHTFILTADGSSVSIVRSGVGTDMVISHISIKEVDGKYLKLTDGTTQLQVACAAGERKVGTAFAESRGDELVTNGTFDTGDFTGWTLVTGVSVNEALQCVMQGDISVTPTYIRQEGVIGNLGSYILSYDVIEDSLDNIGLYLHSTGFTGVATLLDTSVGHHEVEVVAVNTNYLYLRVLGTSSGTLTVDNVSVKEVTNKMNLNLDGTWADLTDSTAYDGTLGSGVLTFGETMRKVKRWNGTDFDKQKAIIDREMS